MAIRTNRSMDQSFKRSGRGVCLEVQALQTRTFSLPDPTINAAYQDGPPSSNHIDSPSKTCDHRGSSYGCHDQFLHQIIQTQPEKGHSLFETYSDKDESMEEIRLNSTEYALKYQSV